MKKIDIYILKKFLGSFLFILLLSSMLTIVVDISEKIDDFLAPKGPTFYEVIFDYYLNLIPYINGMIFPLYALIAVVFFTSRLAANSEFIGMIGNGINFYRLLVPYLIGAFLIAAIHFSLNHYILPISNQTRTAFENTYIWKHNYVGKSSHFHLSCSPYEEFYIQGFSRYDSSAVGLAWIQYDTITGERNRVIKASKAKLISPPNRWRLKGIKKRKKRDSTRFHLTHLAHQYFLDTTLCIDIEDLIQRDNSKDNMSTSALIAFITKQKNKGAGGTTVYEVERFRRSADPFSIIILTIIGFSIASRKIRGGMAWHLVIGFAVCGVYIFIGKFSNTFSINGNLPPVLGTWITNLVFSFVALYMLRGAQK